jgi:hypothetical protein
MEAETIGVNSMRRQSKTRAEFFKIQCSISRYLHRNVAVDSEARIILQLSGRAQPLPAAGTKCNRRHFVKSPVYCTSTPFVRLWSALSSGSHNGREESPECP